MLNGVPQQRLHVSGLLEVNDEPPQAAAVEALFGIDQTPAVRDTFPAEVLKTSPLKIRVQWHPAGDAHVQAAQQDAAAQIVADLAAGTRLQHTAGQVDPLGIALTAPGAADTIAEQVAAVTDTPISVEPDLDGARQRRTANHSQHLSSADAAALLRTGTRATALITGATQAPVPQAMLPSPDASLWDLTLTVQRPDARRNVVGIPGLTLPVRIDPTDHTRVALDSDTYDQQHPDAPPR